MAHFRCLLVAWVLLCRGGVIADDRGAAAAFQDSVRDEYNHYLIQFTPSTVLDKPVEQELADFFGSAVHYIPEDTYMVFTTDSRVEAFHSRAGTVVRVESLPTAAKLRKPSVTRKRADTSKSAAPGICPFPAQPDGALRLIARLSFPTPSATEQFLLQLRQTLPPALQSIILKAVSATAVHIESTYSLCKPLTDFLTHQPAVHFIDSAEVNHLFMTTSNFVIQGGTTFDRYPMWRMGIQGQNQ
eukprot:EG_transcript_26685